MFSNGSVVSEMSNSLKKNCIGSHVKFVCRGDHLGSGEFKRHQLFKLGLRVSNLSFLLHKFDGLVYGV